MTKIQNLIGKTYSRLLVLGLVGTKNNKRIWLCKCSCGNTTEVATSDLNSRNTQSCGCLNIDKIRQRVLGQTWSRKPPGEAGLNRLFRVYKTDAKYRNYQFNLTKDEFKILTSQNCHYCNSSPETKKYGSTKGATKEGLEHSAYVYNGIDRKDNNLGYFLDNCVTSCFKCNKLKGTYSYEEFLEIIRSIYENLCR